MSKKLRIKEAIEDLNNKVIQIESEETEETSEHQLILNKLEEIDKDIKTIKKQLI